MNPDLSNANMAVAILQWFLELASVHPVRFSVLFAVMSISGVIGAASILVEPLILLHRHYETIESIEAAKLKTNSRSRKKVVTPPLPKWRKTLNFLVKFLSVVARNP